MIDNEHEVVTWKQWESYAKRIEKRNLKAHGISISFSGIERYARHHIVEEYTDQKASLVKKGWRDTMKAMPIPDKH